MDQLLPLSFRSSSPNPAANALQSAPRNVISPLILLPPNLLHSSQTVDSNLDGNARVPSVPAQRVITDHLMCFWPSHRYVLSNISLTRSEQTLGLQSSQLFRACPTDPNGTIFDLHFPAPPTDSQIQADPSLKEKTWHLNWMPLAFLASFRPKRQPTRFTSEMWVIFFVKRSERPSHFCMLTLSHAMCIP